MSTTDVETVNGHELYRRLGADEELISLEAYDDFAFQASQNATIVTAQEVLDQVGFILSGCDMVVGSFYRMTYEPGTGYGTGMWPGRVYLSYVCPSVPDCVPLMLLLREKDDFWSQCDCSAMATVIDSQSSYARDMERFFVSGRQGLQRLWVPDFSS